MRGILLFRDNSLDGPEVGGEVGAGEVVVRDPAVAVDTPLGRPGVPDEEHAALVVIPDGQHGMAADISLPFHGQGHEAGVHDDGALERLVDPDAEDERHAGRQGALEGIEIPILQEEGLLKAQPIGRLKGLPGRHVREPGRHIGPVGLVAGAELSDDLRRQVDAGAGVLADRPQLSPLVPVDVEPRGHERPAALALEVELQRRRDRIGGTAAQLRLVVDRRAAGPEVDRLR